MEFTRPVTALASGLIDYAGLFPPAKLSLDVAYGKYRQYLSGDLSWMLDRFVCPWGMITDLESYVADSDPLPVRVSVIAPVPFDDVERFGSFLNDLRRWNSTSNKVLADAIEVKWLEPNANLAAFADQLAALSTELALDTGHLESIYIELPWQTDFPIDEYARAASRWPTTHPVSLGLKVRTGGVEASAFPGTEELARFIGACYRYGVAFKATAGLHHPVRRWNSDTDSMMHGFLNLFWGAAALHAGLVSPDQLADVLDETNPTAFSMDADTISWKGLTLSHEQVADGRRGFARSFGSCSFVEPVEDLQELNLLPDNYAVD